MVDNRGISPLSNIGFKADNASANKMSEEKNGQGGEYFAQEMEEEEQQAPKQNEYQDRSAQLRASLDSLASMSAGSIMFMKTLKEHQKHNEEEENKKKKRATNPIKDSSGEIPEELLDE